MKKEKREFTLKQLEGKKKQCRYVIRLCIVLCVILLLLIAPLIKNNKQDIALCLVCFLGAIGMSADKKLTKLYDRIEKKKKQIRISTIKELAKEGELKKSVKIINKQIIAEILSKNIKKITIDDIEGSNCVTSIQFEDKTCQSKVYISAEKLISILDEKSKREMLQNLINYIGIGNLEETTKEVQIIGKNFLYTNSNMTDEELLKLFDLKEE